MLWLKKIVAFRRAFWSLARFGDAPLTTYQKRRKACLACPKMHAAATGLFCGACGCMKWPLSDLRTKWRLRDLKCPLDEW